MLSPFLPRMTDRDPPPIPRLIEDMSPVIAAITAGNNNATVNTDNTGTDFVSDGCRINRLDRFAQIVVMGRGHLQQTC